MVEKSASVVSRHAYLQGSMGMLLFITTLCLQKTVDSIPRPRGHHVNYTSTEMLGMLQFTLIWVYKQQILSAEVS